MTTPRTKTKKAISGGHRVLRDKTPRADAALGSGAVSAAPRRGLPNRSGREKASSPACDRKLTMAPWQGGKARLIHTLLPLFPAHECYVEAFGGMASCLLNKPRVATEVYNDRDERLFSLFAVIKYHHAPFDQELSMLLKSRQLFDSYKLQPGLTEIQQAARFLYCQTLGFGGAGEHFGTGVTSGGTSARSLEAVREMASRIHQRLQPVTIENLDWEDCLARYDSPATFFFLDPPYLGTTGYAVPFSERDHQVLADRLRKIQGTFLMTNSDSRQIRDLFRGFRMRPIRSAMGRSLDHTQKLHQLAVMNY
jgi:DNA adenine methylase